MPTGSRLVASLPELLDGVMRRCYEERPSPRQGSVRALADLDLAKLALNTPSQDGEKCPRYRFCIERLAPAGATPSPKWTAGREPNFVLMGDSAY